MPDDPDALELPTYFSPAPVDVGENSPAPAPEIDDSHPYAKVLKAIIALATAISVECNKADPDSNFRQYLLNIGYVFPRAKIVRDRRYGWQCVGLRGLYRVVKLAGLPGKPKTKNAVLKAFNDALQLEGGSK